MLRTVGVLTAGVLLIIFLRGRYIGMTTPTSKEVLEKLRKEKQERLQKWLDNGAI